MTLCLASDIVYRKVKVHQDTDQKAKSPMAVRTPRDAPTEEERTAFPEKMAVPINSGVEGQSEKPENHATKVSNSLRTMVANGLAPLTNRNNKQETSEAEVELVPSSQDPTLDEFMSRHIDKIFLRKNGLIFTIRTEKSERTPIQLRNLEISFPMDEVISEKDMLQGISRRVLYTVGPEAW